MIPNNCNVHLQIQVGVPRSLQFADAPLQDLRRRRLHTNASHSRTAIRSSALGKPFDVLSERYTCSSAHRLSNQSSGLDEPEARSHADKLSSRSSSDGFRCSSMLRTLMASI